MGRIITPEYLRSLQPKEIEKDLVSQITVVSPERFGHERVLSGYSSDALLLHIHHHFQKEHVGKSDVIVDPEQKIVKLEEILSDEFSPLYPALLIDMAMGVAMKGNIDPKYTMVFNDGDHEYTAFKLVRREVAPSITTNYRDFLRSVQQYAKKEGYTSRIPVAVRKKMFGG